MSPSLERCWFGVATRDGRLIVEAWRKPSWPGIVVHEAIGYDQGWIRGAWSVSHEASGRFVVAGAKTREEAAEWADAFAALGDWTRHSEDLLADTAFTAAVRDLRYRWVIGWDDPVPSTSRGL